MKITSRQTTDFASEFQQFFRDCCLMRTNTEIYHIVMAFCYMVGAKPTHISIDDKTDHRRIFCTLTANFHNTTITVTGETLTAWA